MKQQQHYISKVLTKSWEHPNSGRQISFFDFNKDEILKSPIKSLFSQIDLWPKDYESIFDKKFERSMTEVIKKIIQCPAELNIQDSSKAIRSIITLHYFNVMRLMCAHWASDDLDRFIKLKPKEMNEEIEFFASQHHFISIPLLDNKCRFFFPESAFFHIPIFNEISNEMDLGFAIPLHPRFALGILPKGYKKTN